MPIQHCSHPSYIEIMSFCGWRGEAYHDHFESGKLASIKETTWLVLIHFICTIIYYVSTGYIIYISLSISAYYMSIAKVVLPAKKS